MSLLHFIITVTAAIGSANATASRLADVMSKATGYKTQLHSNVTAYDICMYLATGYQYNQFGTHKNITTEAYDDHDQGVARILTRHVNDEYDSTIEALNSYNKTQRVANFDVADCKNITEDEVIGWFYSKTAVGTDHDQDLELSRRGAPRSAVCRSPGQNCFSPERTLDSNICSGRSFRIGACGCAEYGSSAAACQTSYLRGTVWYTDHHKNWGEVTALMISFLGRNRWDKRLVGFIATDQEYS